jgi:hypothetical protein
VVEDGEAREWKRGEGRTAVDMPPEYVGDETNECSGAVVVTCGGGERHSQHGIF